MKPIRSSEEVRTKTGEYLIEIPEGGIEGESSVFLLETSDVAPFFQVRPRVCHKGSFGYVTLMGGCIEYAGAAKLAELACAALRSGCGVARLAIPHAILPFVAPHTLESTLFPMPSDESGRIRFDREAIDRALAGQTALSLGMGWGRSEEYGRILSYILREKSLRLVLDADALNTLAEHGPELLIGSNCRILLTPHPAEMARLAACTVQEVLRDSIGTARAFAARYGVIVLLKGACTTVSDGRVTYLVDRGCAGMATAGSGDVLSGVLTGLFGYHEVSARSAAAGAYLAGLAGELAEQEVGDLSMLASDTVRYLPKAVEKIRNLSK